MMHESPTNGRNQMQTPSATYELNGPTNEIAKRASRQTPPNTHARATSCLMSTCRQVRF
jgi:hypothetical protein